MDKVTVARVLLPAGLELLEGKVEVVEGGLDSDRDGLLAIVPGSVAIVADPTVPVDREVIEAAGPGLRLIANFAVGYDNVDLEAAEEAGLFVTNTPDVLTDATAELAAGLAFAAARGIPERDRLLRDGSWTGWDPGGFRGIELSGATVGVVGLGRIGRRFAEIMAGIHARCYATAEEYGLAGQWRAAVEQLRIARRLGTLDFYTASLADARMREFEAAFAQEQREQPR